MTASVEAPRQDDPAGTTTTQEGSVEDSESVEGPPVDSPRTYTADEYGVLSRRLAAADRAKGDAEKRAKSLEDRDKSELERTKAALADALSGAEKSHQQIRKMRIANKFLAVNTHLWHDSEAALILVDLSDVTISDDGVVTGLEAAVEKLAKDKPYLVKDVKEKKTAAPTPNRPSGNNPKPDVDDRAVDRARLAAKYPALRGRTDVP